LGSRYYARILLLKNMQCSVSGLLNGSKTCMDYFFIFLFFFLMMFLFVWYFRPPMYWKQRKVILMLLQFTLVGMILCVLSAMVAASKFLLPELLGLKLCSLSIYIHPKKYFNAVSQLAYLKLAVPSTCIS